MVTDCRVPFSPTRGLCHSYLPLQLQAKRQRCEARTVCTRTTETTEKVNAYKKEYEEQET
jgi:hypothetical protein